MSRRWTDALSPAILSMGLRTDSGRSQRVRRHEQRVARVDAQLLAHLGVDDRVDGRHLRRVGADSHTRCVAAATERSTPFFAGIRPFSFFTRASWPAATRSHCSSRFALPMRV